METKTKERIIEFCNRYVIHPFFAFCFSEVPDASFLHAIAAFFKPHCLCCFFWRGVLLGFFTTVLATSLLGYSFCKGVLILFVCGFIVYSGLKKLYRHIEKIVLML